MRKHRELFILTCVLCGCGAGVDTPATTSPDAGGAALSGTPGASFCEGDKLWTYTKSGRDAVGGLDCTTVNSSTTNPSGCFTSSCPAGQTACCRTTVPSCNWNLSVPSLVGNSFAPGTAICGATPGCSFFNVQLLDNNPRVCSSSQLSLTLPRPWTGQVFHLPAPGVTLSLISGSSTCVNWTGTVTWNADVPAWRVTLDAHCSDAGSTLAVVGTISGQQ